MKKIAAAAMAALTAAVIGITAPAAFAHTSGLGVAAVCNTQTGMYDVTWTVGPTTNLDLSPAITQSDRVAIPASTKLTSASTNFKESIAGTATSVSAAITVLWTNEESHVYQASTTLDGKCVKPTPPPAPVCPDGYNSAGSSNGVLLCTRTVTNTNTVTNTVYGKPSCPAGSTQSAAGEGYVVCQLPPVITPPPPPVTITKIVRTPGKTITIVRIRWKTVVHVRVVKICHKTGPGKG